MSLCAYDLILTDKYVIWETSQGKHKRTLSALFPDFIPRFLKLKLLNTFKRLLLRMYMYSHCVLLCVNLRDRKPNLFPTALLPRFTAHRCFVPFTVVNVNQDLFIFNYFFTIMRKFGVDLKIHFKWLILNSCQFETCQIPVLKLAKHISNIPTAI